MAYITHFKFDNVVNEILAFMESLKSYSTDCTQHETSTSTHSQLQSYYFLVSATILQLIIIEATPVPTKVTIPTVSFSSYLIRVSISFSC